MMAHTSDIALAGAPHLHPEAAARAAAWLHATGGAPLVVIGPEGSGKTQLVARVLAACDTIRFDCFPALTAAELLEELGLALMARGDACLNEAVERELHFALQLDAARNALARHEVCLWLDDAAYLVRGHVDAFESLRHEMRDLLQMLGDHVRGGGRLVISGDDTGVLLEDLGFDHAPTIALAALDPQQARVIWQAFGGESRRQPPGAATALDLRIAAACDAHTAKDSAPGAGDALARAWTALSAPARTLLEYLAVTPGRLTLGLLRHIVRHAGIDESAPAELSARGLLEPGAPASNRVFLNPAVCARAAALARGAIPADLADYWKAQGARTRRIWDLLRAIDLYFKAENVQAVYEVERELVERLLRRGYLDLCEDILTRTVNKAQGRMRAVALGNLAIVKKNQGEYRKAQCLYEEAWQEFEALNDEPNIARVLHQLGNTHYLQGNLDTATQHYEHSRQVAARCGDDSVAAAAQIQTANLLFVKEDFEEAGLQYRQGLARAEKLGDQRMVLAVLLQIGQIHLALQAPMDAEEVFERADNLADSLGDGDSRVKALHFRGIVARGRGDAERATGFLHLALDLGKRLRSPSLEAASHHHLGQTRLEQGDYVAALEHLAVALSTFAAQGMEEARTTSDLIQDLADTVGEEAFRKLANTAGCTWLLPSGDTEQDSGGNG